MLIMRAGKEGARMSASVYVSGIVQEGRKCGRLEARGASQKEMIME